MHIITLTAKGWETYSGDLCGLDFRDGKAESFEAPHGAMHQLREMAPVLSADGPGFVPVPVATADIPAPTVAEFLASCEVDDLVGIGINAKQAESVIEKARAFLAEHA